MTGRIIVENNKITALASPNIAFIKYWGNRDEELRIPLNGSISMELGELHTETSVVFTPFIEMDQVTINGKPGSLAAFLRVSKLLDHVRQLARIHDHAAVHSRNNFPMGTGIASSASAFAALSLAASVAAGLELSKVDLSRLARLGSGSACRSITGGFSEWHAGSKDEDSFATQLVPADHWDLVDCIAIVNEEHKPVSSSEGHYLSSTSPIQWVRVRDAHNRLATCRKAILEKDFESFAEVVEQDSNLMHSVMCTSAPELIYWNESSFDIIAGILELRKKGIAACYTMDAGPNVHVITLQSWEEEVMAFLRKIPGVNKVLISTAGNGARLAN